MNNYEKMFLNLNDLERSRVQLQAIKEGYFITSFEDTMDTLPSFYAPKIVRPSEDVRVYYPRLDRSTQDAVISFFESQADNKYPTLFTPDVRKNEINAAALLRFLVTCKNDSYVSNYEAEYPLRKITQSEQSDLLKRYGLNTKTEGVVVVEKEIVPSAFLEKLRNFFCLK